MAVPPKLSAQTNKLRRHGCKNYSHTLISGRDQLRNFVLKYYAKESTEIMSSMITIRDRNNATVWQKYAP
jgi:hypothetical protein